MAQCIRFGDFCTYRKLHAVLLALSWILGLGFGAFISRTTGSNLASQMPLAAYCQPSIFGLLISFLLPFLFSAFAVYMGSPKLLYFIAFVKALFTGFICAAVYASFANSAWLVRILLMFTDSCGVMMLYHYWLRHVSGLRRFSAGIFAAYLIPLFGVALADYYYVSPLLQRVLL